MNYRGEVTTAWGDGELYDFKLTVAGIIELEEKCSAPFAVIFGRVHKGEYALTDIRETLRLGLIGGGKKPAEAKKLSDAYILPLGENAPVARLILLAAMFGFEAHPLKKDEAAPTASTNASTPQPSSEAPSSPGSGRMSLEEFHSGNWLP